MSEELILVEKDGAQIRVHPGTLENHKQLGWMVVEETAKAASEETPEPKKGKGK